MIKSLKGTLIVSLLLTLSHAESNQSTQNDFIYIDKLHSSISRSIIEWSDIIDTTVSDWLEDSNWFEDNETNSSNTESNVTDIEDNITVVESNIIDIDTNTTFVEANTTSKVTYAQSKKSTIATPIRADRDNIVSPVTKSTPSLENNASKKTLEERIQSADAFFQNNKYLDETENNYVRIRLESYLQSKESSDFDLTLRAQIPFKKSKKHLKIFIDNLNVDNAKDVLQDDKDDSPDIGLSYFAPETYGINTRYSLGLSGIDPFVKVRYNKLIKTDKWLIDLVQQFKYSSDYKFEEESNIYFDKEVGKKSLLRIQLYRSTQEDEDGMNYALSLQYYESLKKHTGFGFGQTLVGNTEYEYIDDGQEKTFGGINNYVTSVSLRKNVWREWFFYEVRPSVSFHKEYDYEANYRVRVFFDIYLGKFN